MCKLFLLLRYRKQVWFKVDISLKKFTRGKVENEFLGINDKQQNVYFLKSSLRRILVSDLSLLMLKSPFNLINVFSVNKLKLIQLQQVLKDYIKNNIKYNRKILWNYDYNFKWLFVVLDNDFFDNLFIKLSKKYSLKILIKPFITAIDNSEIIIDAENNFIPKYKYIFDSFNNFVFFRNHWCLQIFPQSLQFKVNNIFGIFRYIFNKNERWFWRLDSIEIALLIKYFQFWFLLNLKLKAKTLNKLILKDEYKHLYLSPPKKKQIEKNIILPKGMSLETYAKERKEYLEYRYKRFNSSKFNDFSTSAAEFEELLKLQPNYESHNSTEQYKDIILKYKNVQEKYPRYEKYKRMEIKEQKRKKIFNKILLAMNKLSGVSDTFMNETFNNRLNNLTKKKKK
jgi:hypothetical protein